MYVANMVVDTAGGQGDDSSCQENIPCLLAMVIIRTWPRGAAEVTVC